MTEKDPVVTAQWKLHGLEHDFESSLNYIYHYITDTERDLYKIKNSWDKLPLEERIKLVIKTVEFVDARTTGSIKMMKNHAKQLVKIQEELRQATIGEK